VGTVADIKNEARSELSPINPDDLDQDHIDISVEQAVQKYTSHTPLVGRTQKDYTKKIDLSSVNGTIRNVIDVIPDKDDLIDFVYSDSNALFLGQGMQLGTGMASGSLGVTDARNSLTNYVQSVDLWNQIQQFLGDSATFHWVGDEQALYLDNYPDGVSLVTIQYEYEPETVDDTLEIGEPSAYNWIRDYTIARTLERVGRITGADQDGSPDLNSQAIHSDGREDRKRLEDELKEQRDIIL
jgi:hypothetical protein